MFLRELITEAPLRIRITEGVPGWLISIILIDTSSSQWRKTKRGSIQTEELKCVQTALKALGYNPGKIDGWFGKKTARAVMKFQEDNGLTVDGDPGRNTIGKMIEIARSRYPAAEDLTKDNVDDRFPEDEYPDRQKCDAVLEPKPEEDDEDDDEDDEIVAPGREDLPVGGLPAAPFDPVNAIQGKSVEEVYGIVEQLIRQRRYKDALAVIDYDMRLDINDSTYTQIQQLAATGESLEEKQVWARSGMKVVRKYRCSSGSRRGRVVKEPSQCFKAKDIKKRMKLKQTKARLGARMARKAKRTKKFNPASRRVQAMNR